jgi:hypothetical protein
MHRHAALAVAAIITPLSFVATPDDPPATGAPRILVSPNVLASHDGPYPHTELMVAANPRDPKHLLGGAVAFTRAEGGLENKGYVSFDGGWSWEDIRFPQQYHVGGADPQVAFGRTGTAIFTALGTGLEVYRSENGGKTWEEPKFLGRGYDHEQIIVDHSMGKYAGRMYLGVMYGRSPRRYIIGVFRSEDDGKTWIGPVEVEHRPGFGLNVNNLLLFSDGTLVVPYTDFRYESAQRMRDTTCAFYFKESSDGGVTFSQSYKIHDRWRLGNPEVDRREAAGDFASYTFAQFAIDTTAKFRDRFYTVWNDYKSGKSRLLFSYSKDRGRTWTAPKMLIENLPALSQQYQQMVTVNKDGVVGVMYYDTRDGVSYDVYFTASVDGGETFIAPAKVTSVSSKPASDINARPVPLSARGGESSLGVSFISAYSRYMHAGDYMGLTADVQGTFHLFWADARDGSYQIYSSRVLVSADGSVPGVAKDLTPATLNAKTSMVFDPGSYNEKAREALLVARLKNSSNDTIYGPFKLELVPESAPSASGVAGTEDTTRTILNALNGKGGLGATFEFSASALRDLPYLAPGAVTEPITLRVRALNNAATGFRLDFKVTGFLPVKK